MRARAAEAAARSGGNGPQRAAGAGREGALRRPAGGSLSLPSPGRVPKPHCLGHVPSNLEGEKQRSFLIKNYYLKKKNGFHSLFLSVLSEGQKEAKSNTKNPFQTSKQEKTRRLPDVDVLFFDINLCTHMGVFIDSCSHLLNFLLFI